MPRLGLRSGNGRNAYLEQYSQLLTWNFPPGAGGANSSSIVSTSINNATSLNPNISGSFLSTSGTTNGNTQSPTYTWNRTYALFYATSALAMAAGRYISWSITVNPSKTIVVTGFSGLSAERNTTGGPTKVDLYISSDGINYSVIGQTADITTSKAPIGPVLTSTFQTSPLVLADIWTTTYYFRLVPYANFNGISGRLGFWNNELNNDDFSMLGYVY